MPELVIQCVQLTKVFKDFWLRPRVKAVDAIDLDVQRGEVFGLLGPNGSGKSTTIKMILGLLHPTSGRIAVLGRSPRDVKIKEQIGYLPEESYLYKFLNARETLEYYGRLFHQDRRRRQRRIDELLEMVGLDKVQRRPIGEYSKGMQRRIGLAQALINDPQLLILDEPTTGLDPIGTRQIKDLIVRLKDVGKTVLLCSHLLADVEDVTDRCVIMFGGKVRRAGTIDELLTKHDETTITTDVLPPEVEEQVVAALEQRGLLRVQVRRSRQRLESLFLDIVDQAQREGLATAGAGNKGGVASFLTEAGRPVSTTYEPPDGQLVIEQLTHKQPVQPTPAQRKPEPTPQPAADAVLEELTGNKPAPGKSSPPPATPPSPPPPSSPQPDRSVIDDLLG
jgi:ABC-2 type transport system ATP-binding protein